MKKIKLNKILVGVILFAALPALAFAQATPASTPAATPATAAVPNGFSGIFSCNQTGAAAMSVGALGATGGVYVPVADATVELNTGTLVYKECILREIVDAQRIAATAGFTQQTIAQIQTARSGSPLYVVQPLQEKVTADNQVVSDDLQTNATLNSLDPSIKPAVQQAIARAYVTGTQNAASMLACPYQGSAADFTSANPQAPIFNDILAVGSDCDPLFGYIDSYDYVAGDIGAANDLLDQEWLWGEGLYPVTTGGSNPLTQKITTPSSLVNSSYTQVVTSAFNQLQNANDLGQMVGALFAGISTQVTSPNGGGLAGINQPIGNSPSYLQQAVSQTTQNLQQTVDNAALVNLNAAFTIEQSYFNIMTGIANDITQAISQLRGAEATCWTQIIKTVCATPLTAQNTCTEVTTCTTDVDGDQTCPTGATLHVATSTAFSQAIITAQITTLGQTIATNIQTSQTALNLIGNLIQGVSSSGADAQAVAIAQLNSLIVNKQLHTQADLTTAQQQKTSVETFLSGNTNTTPPGGLVSNAISLWAGTDPNNTNTPPPNGLPWNGSVGATLDASSPGVGWCNFKNPTTLQAWESKWSS
jgi:hypothetical protein